MNHRRKGNSVPEDIMLDMFEKQFGFHIKTTKTIFLTLCSIIRKITMSH